MASTIKITMLICILLTTLPGCLKVYKKDIRQGNHVTQEMLAQLRPNMTKLQVQNIMGTPALIPVFNLSRWDYYYFFKPGDNSEITEKKLSLYFRNDQLVNYSGDWQVANLPRR